MDNDCDLPDTPTEELREELDTLLQEIQHARHCAKVDDAIEMLEELVALQASSE